jgi:hypothetical protein
LRWCIVVMYGLLLWLNVLLWMCISVAMHCCDDVLLRWCMVVTRYRCDYVLLWGCVVIVYCCDDVLVVVM